MQTQKQQEIKLSETQTQRAFWISLGTGIAMLIILAILLLTSGAELSGPKDVRVFAAGLALFGFVSAWLTRQGRAIIGIGLLLGMFYITTVITTLSIADVGIAIGTVTFVLTFGVTSAIFPSTKLAKYINNLALALAIGMVLLDVFKPFKRAENTTPEVTWGLAIFLLFIYGAVIFRQLGSYPLRTKLLLAFLAVTIIPLALIAFFNDRNTRNTLTENASVALLSAASTTASELDTFILDNLDFVRTEAQLPNLVEYLSLLPSQRSEKEAEIIEILSIIQNLDPGYIDSVAIYDLKGNTLLDTLTSDIGVNKSDRSWFKQPLKTGLPYASNLEFSQTTGAASIYFSALIRDSAGRNIGILRIRYLGSVLQNLISSKNNLLGQGSFAVLVDGETHMRLAHGASPDIIFKTIVPPDATTVSEFQAQRRFPPGTSEEFSTNLPEFETALQNYQTQPFFVTELKIGDNTLEQGAITTMKNQNWHVIYAQEQEAFLIPINAQARNNLILTIGIGLLVAFFAVFISNTLAGPITRLTQVAEAISSGDLSAQAKVESEDEIGTLAVAFNSMTARLSEFIGTLEQRVAERTAKMERRNLDLALATEIGQTVSQVGEIDVMLKDAAEIIRTFFGLYYVQIYLVNPTQTELVLQIGTGTVGAELLSRGHRLPLNTDSINGRAAITKRSVVIADTATSSFFRPNPLLPNTRSEIAVPLVVGDRLIGVLDAQSEQAGLLNMDALLAFEPMAGQMAIAIQNSRLIAETERARAEVEALARRLTHEGWENYMDAIHQPEQISYVFQHEQVKPLDEMVEEESDATVTPNEDAFAAPILVSGEKLGTLIVEMEEQKRSAQAERLIFAVARQVSQQIENLRLLDSAERSRFEVEETARRQTREGWQEYIRARGGKPLNYLYDLNEVKPIDSKEEPIAEESNIVLPLKVRDEVVGKLAVSEISPSDQASLNLASAVAERLSTHIENLRLAEKTRERAEREQALRQITSAVRGSTDPAIILRTAARELGTMLGRKTIIRLATTQEARKQEPPETPDSPAHSENNDAKPDVVGGTE